MPAGPSAAGHRAGRDPRPEPAAGGPAGAAARLAQPARVRLRRDRGGQVADRAVPARGRDRAGHPVAGGRARQGRVPADGGAPAGHGGDQDQAGRAGRDRGRAQPARARGRSGRRQVPAADARGPGQGAVHRVLPVRGAVPAGAQRRARPGLRGRGLGPRARRARRRRARDAAYPTLTALQRAAERVVTEIGYSQRVTDDVLGFIRVRLASLRHGTDRPLPRGRAPDRFRRAAGQERGARDRGRRRRRRQGVPDGRGADPAGRAPAARPPDQPGRARPACGT